MKDETREALKRELIRLLPTNPKKAFTADAIWKKIDRNLKQLITESTFHVYLSQLGGDSSSGIKKVNKGIGYYATLRTNAIHIIWTKPIDLSTRKPKKITKDINVLSNVRKKPGIYVFVRRHGSNSGEHIPIYVGKTRNLHSRLTNYLRRHNNHDQEIVDGIESKPNGKRFLLVGVLKYNGSSQELIDKKLQVLEETFINLALEVTKRDLLNVQLTKRPVTTIISNSPRDNLRPFERFLQIEEGKNVIDARANIPAAYKS